MSAKKTQTSPVEAVYMLRFGSKRHEPPTDRDEASSQSRRDRRGNKRGNDTEKRRFLLKVKLPKLQKLSLSKKEGRKEAESQKRWMFETTENKTKTSLSPEGEKLGVGTQSHSVGGDIFFFSEEPTGKAIINEKEKVKLAVLRTISKVLEENQLIRQRVAALSQTSRGCMD